jgi:tripartite-type tricarboxylate transporter receptor subunit TctC
VNAVPDGHTLLVSGTTSYTILPALRAKPPYDPLKDLAPLMLVANVPTVIVTSANKPFKTIEDVIAQARAKPHSITYSTFGPGTTPHLSGALFADAARIAIDAVPYKGSSEAVLGLLRGDVDLGFETLTAVSAGVKAGQLRVLATQGAKRTPFMPELRSMTDLKMPQAAVDGYYAVAVPAKTPADVQARIENELAAVMATPEVKEALAKQSLEAVLVGRNQFRSMISADLERFRSLAQRLQLTVD